MRAKIITTLFLVLAVSQANAATVNFEEFAVGDGAGPFPTVLTSQGYEFSGQAAPFASAEVLTGTNTGGTNAYGGSINGVGQDGFNVSAFVTIEKADGGAFAIQSLDYFLDADSLGSTEIRGQLAGGGITFLSGVAVGTGDWLNLQSVTFRADANGFGFGFATAEIDNVMLTAVPIPAAVWLFGSGLGMLGWMRRRQSNVAQ